MQTVFLEAFSKLSSYKGTAPFEHWLMRTATTLAMIFCANTSATVSGTPRISRMRRTIGLKIWARNPMPTPIRKRRSVGGQTAR